MSIKKKAAYFLIILLSGLIIFLGYTGWQFYSAFEETTEEVEPEEDQADLADSIDAERGEDYLVFLIFGIDTTTDEGLHGRSDVIMLKTLNFRTGQITSLSIPRDTRTRVTEYDRNEKLGHAYAYSTESAIETVENLFGIPVDYYIALNFDAFINFVDLLGGLELNVDQNMRVGDITLTEGFQNLNGEEALTYVRFRGDIEGDFGRIRRQQKVIQEVLDETVRIRTVPNVMEMLEITEDNVIHDIPLSEMRSIIPQIGDITSQDYTSLFMLSFRTIIDDIAYAKISDIEIDYISNQLKKSLEH